MSSAPGSGTELEQTARFTDTDRSAMGRNGRSLPVFLVASTTAIAGFVGRWGPAGIVVGFLVAFGFTEAFARRFPEGVRLGWLFRPNLLALGVVGGLVLLAVYLVPTGTTCIEGGTVTGFPFPVFEQCNRPGGTPDIPRFNLFGMALNVVLWYVLGTLTAGLVRPRNPLSRVLA